MSISIERVLELSKEIMELEQALDKAKNDLRILVRSTEKSATKRKKKNVVRVNGDTHKKRRRSEEERIFDLFAAVKRAKGPVSQWAALKHYGGGAMQKKAKVAMKKLVADGKVRKVKVTQKNGASVWRYTAN